MQPVDEIQKRFFIATAEGVDQPFLWRGRRVWYGRGLRTCRRYGSGKERGPGSDSNTSRAREVSLPSIGNVIDVGGSPALGCLVVRDHASAASFVGRWVTCSCIDSKAADVPFGGRRRKRLPSKALWRLGGERIERAQGSDSQYFRRFPTRP